MPHNDLIRTDLSLIYCEKSCNSNDHTGCNCFIGGFINQDDASGDPVSCIGSKNRGLVVRILPGNIIHPDCFLYRDFPSSVLIFST